MLDIDKSGLCKKNNFFSSIIINKFEHQLIFYIHSYTKKKFKKISLKAKKILNLKSKDFRVESIKLLEEIEQTNKKLFYEISITCGKTFGLNTFDITKKNNKFLKKYFKEQFLNIEKLNPQLLFSKKNNSRLSFKWHQDAPYYPGYKVLTLWTPLFRDIKKDNDGGLKFNLGSNKKIYKFKNFKTAGGYRQKIPRINVDKKFKIFSTDVNRTDVIFFEGKLMHKTDQQLNIIPRVAIGIRYISAFF
tara:strand:+ start:1214 stop:1951 length:738 start_codon:yes stop_codon:yes gene_type:complete